MSPLSRGRLAALCGGLLLWTGCAATQPLLPDCPAAMTTPRAKTVVGRHDGPDTPEGRDLAQGRALREALSELGVRVEAGFTGIEREATVVGPEGATTIGTSEIRSTLKVTLPQGEVRGMRSRACHHQDGALGMVLTIPRSEWAMLERSIRGRTVVLLQCETPVEGACGSSIETAVSQAATAAGLAVSEAITVGDTPGFGSGEEATRLGAEHDAAHVLWVRLVGSFLKHDIKGVFFGVTEASATLQETRDGKGLMSWRGDGRYKEGATTALEASRGSLMAAIRGDTRGDDDGGIAQALKTWRAIRKR